MAFGVTREQLEFLLRVDDQASAAFTKVGKTADVELGKAEKKTKGFAGNVTAGLDKLVARSPVAAAALDKVGLSTSQLGALAGPALVSGLAVGGAAIGAFAIKGVQDFRDLAIESGKFADATGLSVESASRYIAVADDVGVSADTFQNAFVKMEKAIQTNRTAFGDLVATTKDGSVDLDATFLNVVKRLQSIKDPIERANEASKFFGRGFAEVAEILGTSADELKAKFDSVADAQLINPEERKRADDLRAAQDRLGESVSDLALELGGGLAPAATEAANSLAGLIEIAGKVTGPLGGIGGTIEKIANNAPIFGSALQFGGIFEDGASGVDRFGSAVGVVIPVVGNLIKGLDGVKVSATAAALGIAEVAGVDLPSTLDAGTVSAGGWGRAIDAASLANKQATLSADAYARSVTGETAALEANKAAQEAETNAKLAAVNVAFAQHAAQQGVIDAQENLNELQASGTATALELQIGTDQVVQSMLTLAAQNQEAAKAAGVADGGQQAFISTLEYLSGTASPAVKAELDVLIASLKETDETNAEPDVTLNDQATSGLTAVQGLLSDLDGDSATVDIRANNEQAIASLNAVRDKLTTIGNLKVGLGASGFDLASGGPIPGRRGEPVVGVAHGGEYVLDAGTVDAIKRDRPSKGSANGSTIGDGGIYGGTTIINLPVGSDPNSVVRAQTRWQRRNGTR